MEQWNNLAPVDQLQRLVPHLDEDIGKTLFLATPKPKRKEAKENNSNFKALSFLQKLILVANKPKMAQKAVNNDLCASAVQAAMAELDRTPSSISTPTNPTTTTPPRPRSSSLTHPTESQYIGTTTLAFQVQMTKPMACKITHLAQTTSQYEGLVSQVGALPGQAAAAGVEVGMHVRGINDIDCAGKDLLFVLTTIKQIKKDKGLLVLHLSHDEGEVGAIAPVVVHKESRQERGTRLMNEWIQEESIQAWKAKSWLEKFHLLIDSCSMMEATRLFKETPVKIRKKCKEKTGVEKFQQLTMKEKCKKLPLKDKHCKTLVKDKVDKHLKQPCLLKLGQGKWEKLESSEKLTIMNPKSATQAQKQVPDKKKCLYCDAELQINHMAAHVSVMHPFGGKSGGRCCLVLVVDVWPRWQWWLFGVCR